MDNSDARPKFPSKIIIEDVTLSFIRQRKPVKLLKKLKVEKFVVEEKWKGIYYISKEGMIRIQIIVSKELSFENHVLLNSLSTKINMKQAVKLIYVTQELEQLDDKNYADSLWEIVANVNEQIIEKVMEEERMCENIFSLLEELGEITEEIKAVVIAEKDISKLKAWHKIAAKVESIEEFLEKVQCFSTV